MAGLAPAIHAIPLRNGKLLWRKAYSSSLIGARRGCPRQARA
jgi:hypothetical protein